MPHATSLEENSFMIGRTDSLERRCDIPGCQIFVFEQGCCIVSSKGLRIAVKPGDMAIIFPETSFVQPPDKFGVLGFSLPISYFFVVRKAEADVEPLAGADKDVCI